MRVLAAFVLIMISSIAEAETDVQFVLDERQGVSSAAFSPDGRYVVSGGHDATIRLWEKDTGKLIYLIAITSERPDDDRLRWDVMSVAFSPDGRLIASGSRDRTVRLWDTKSGIQIKLYRGHEAGLRSVVFSPKGESIASAGHDGARIWKLKNPEEQSRVLEGHKGAVMSVAFNADGSLLASGSHDSTVRIWEASTSKQVRVLKAGEPVSAVAFSPDGRYVAASTEKWPGKVILWQAETGSEIRQFQGHTSGVTSLAFSPDGRYVASGEIDPATVRLWEIETGNQVKALQIPSREYVKEENGQKMKVFLPSQPVRAVAFSPDGRYIVSGSDQETPRLWDAVTGKFIRMFGE